MKTKSSCKYCKDLVWFDNHLVLSKLSNHHSPTKNISFWALKLCLYWHFCTLCGKPKQSLGCKPKKFYVATPLGPMIDTMFFENLSLIYFCSKIPHHNQSRFFEIIVKIQFHSFLVLSNSLFSLQWFLIAINIMFRCIKFLILFSTTHSFWNTNFWSLNFPFF